MFDEIMKALHAKNPYEGFDTTGFRHDLEGWNSERATLRNVIDRVRPKLILEVGVWKGASAIAMGRQLGKLDLDCPIVCIDTWLGSLDFWQDQDVRSKYQSLNMRHGYPTVYYQFLYNVIHNRMTDRMIPFPQTSSIACRWLEWKGIRADLIYIDASHDEQDVYVDICNYFGLLRDDGVMIGDDYYDGCPTVQNAVQRFCRERQLEFSTEEDQFWVLRRNAFKAVNP